MDTKLRNISTNKLTKSIVFILVVILITAAVVQGLYAMLLDMNPEALFVKEYKDSEAFHWKYVSPALYNTTSLMESDSETLKDIEFYYYITNGEETYSNAPKEEKSFFEQYEDAFFAIEKGDWSVGKNTNPAIISRRYAPYIEYTTYIAFSDEFMAEKQQQWQEYREVLLPYAIRIIACLALSLILIIYLIMVTGRRPEDKELHLSRIDHIYSDILFSMLIPIGVIWAVIMREILNAIGYYMTNRLNMEQLISLVGVGAITAIGTILCLSILLSLIRKFKARRLIKHSFIYKICYRVYDFIKSLFDGRRFEKYPLTKSLFYRQMLFIIASAVLVFFTFLFLMAVPALTLLPPILEAVLIYWYIKYNNKTFEDISKGFNESLEEQMKSERMKVALVTNVSHDLKTPLTSIISYIDLLSKEEGLSETARDYVNILAQKSNRLKQIVSDLFDLAKSTSGNIDLDLETLDMKRLIEQTIGDMEDEIEKSGLQVKTNLPDIPMNIRSDGKRLYRIFQNVMDNALKYSLKGTRIYIDLEEVNGKAVATIKNIAGYEMDFTPEEILQRFNRGDKSRSTEGSGLGLSIAESFTNVTGGNLGIDIDGDLFKVIISYHLA